MAIKDLRIPIGRPFDNRIQPSATDMALEPGDQPYCLRGCHLQEPRTSQVPGLSFLSVNLAPLEPEHA
jgi:hypothetical protein